MAGTLYVSANLTSSEWIGIRNAEAKQFPNDMLSGAEIVRRYAVWGWRH